MAIRLQTADRLLLAAALVLLSAGIRANDFYIGQFIVDDRRVNAQDPHIMHYRIAHDDPGLLHSQLKERIRTTARSHEDVTFSLNGYPVAALPRPGRKQLDPSFLVDYLQPQIQALKARIEERYGPRPSPDELEQFVFDHIEKKNLAHGFDVASIVAGSRSGDCTEHAVLLAALLRLYDYPARIIIGVFISLQDPVSGYGHAWAEYHGEAGWTGIDGTRIDTAVGAHYIPLGVIEDESAAYRLAVLGTLRHLSIDRIVIE